MRKRYRCIGYQCNNNEKGITDCDYHLGDKLGAKHSPLVIESPNFLALAGRRLFFDVWSVEKSPSSIASGQSRRRHCREPRYPCFFALLVESFRTWNKYRVGVYGIRIENRIVPYCVFTDPQLGSVGIAEKEAQTARRKLRIGAIPTPHVARAIERDKSAVPMEVIVDAAINRILGAAILGCKDGERVHVLYTLLPGNPPYFLLKGAMYIRPILLKDISLCWSA